MKIKYKSKSKYVYTLCAFSAFYKDSLTLQMPNKSCKIKQMGFLVIQMIVDILQFCVLLNDWLLRGLIKIMGNLVKIF